MADVNYYNNLLKTDALGAGALKDQQTTPDYNSMVVQDIKEQDDILQKMLNVAKNTSPDPDLTGEAQTLSQDLDVPVNPYTNLTIEDLKNFKKQNDLKQIELSQQSPILANQLRNPNFAQLAYDDIEQLSGIESMFKGIQDMPDNISNGFEAGRLTVELGRIGERQKINGGKLNEDDKARLVEINARLKELHKDGIGFWNSASEIVGQMSQTIPDAIVFGGYTAVATGTAASIPALAGPQAAVAPLTVGGATLAGFFAGFTAKMGADAYVIESGHSYLDMINAGVDPDIAQYASTGVGLVNASLEIVGLKYVAAPFKKALTKAVTTKMAESMKKKSFASAMAAFGKSYGKAWTAEVSTEVLQEISAMAGEEIAKAFDDGEYEALMSTEEGRDQIADRLMQIFEKVGKGMALLALPGAGVSFTQEAVAASKSKKETAFIESLNNASEVNKVKGRNKDAFKNYVQAVADGSNVENIYVNAEKFNQALTDSDVTLEQLKETMPEVAQQLEEALNQDGTTNDILVPTGEYASNIAGTQLGEAMKPHMRVSEESMSAEEALQFQRDRAAMEAEAQAIIEEKNLEIEGFKESAAAVKKAVLDQLSNTKVYTANVNQAFADHVRDFVVTQAAELGIDPMSFYNQYAYKILGTQQLQPGQMQDPAILTQELFEQDGKVKTESKQFKEFYGNSVLKDDQGAPLVLYHGTADNIDAFDLDSPNRGDTGWLGTGVYMTDSPILAKFYAEGKQQKKRIRPEMSDDQDVGAQIMPLYARLENPYRATLDEKYQIKDLGRKGADAFTAKLIAEGYDGVIMPIDQESNEIVVFDPKMVKSTFNSGTWSTETADLLKQQGPVSQVTGKSSGLLYEFVPEGQIPTETRTAYKLMKIQSSRPGVAFPLFAKPEQGGAQGYTGGQWFLAENQRPTIGNKQLAERPGIHAVNLPVFDQGKAKVKGQQRVWVEVQLPAISEATQAESNNSPVMKNGMLEGIKNRLIGPQESYDYKTNPNASNDAGGWPIAGSMRITRVIPDSEIKNILEENGLDNQVENSMTGIDDSRAQEITGQMNDLGAAFDSESGAVFNQGAMPTIPGASNVPGNSGGFMPYLRVTSKDKVPAKKKPLFAQETKNTTAPRQIAAIDEVLERHPDPVASPEAWAAMMTDALATNEVPAPPYNFIKNMANDGAGAVELLSTLSPGQIEDANHGFENAAGFRDDYINGRIAIEDTGKLFLWSFLSRGVSPYTQEGLFIDSFYGIEPWITMAAEGNFDPDGARIVYPEFGTAAELSQVLFERALFSWETASAKIKKTTPKPQQSDAAFEVEQRPDGPAITYRQWASTTAPKGSGQPGAGAAHNLNAFGATFMKKMSLDAGDGTGRTRLQVLHDMMGDPEATGKSVRRKFLEMGEGVGIDNKVVSFTLLVAGFDDVLVLDRVQIREMWNDGRFDGINLYDGFKLLNEKTGKKTTAAGSDLASLTYGGRGLLVYEALENALLNRVEGIYEQLGRVENASAGRYHWETWVASSNQEASHATIDAILAAARGVNQPLEGVTAKEGEYGAFAYGARYGRNGNNVPYFLYSVPGKADYRFTVDDFQTFLGEIKKPKNKVVPAGFKVTESGNQAWYMRPDVSLDNLDVLAQTLGEKYEAISISEQDVENGIDQPVANRLATNTAIDGDILRQSAIGDGSSGQSNARDATDSGDTASNERIEEEALTPEQLRQQSEQGAVDAAANQGAQFNQEARGGFDPRKLATMLNKDADYSTFLHETAHFFLTVYSDMAALPNATPKMQQDMQAILDWFGIKDLATWNAMSLEQQRQYHEQFAYNYEIYLFEGKAPSKDMQTLFDKFSRFLRRVYKSIRDELNVLYRKENGKDLPMLTDEIRSVMDRMIASEEQITEAEQVYGMQPMFATQEQSGMDDATWAEYQETIKAAHDDAVVDLNKASMRQVKWLGNARTKVLKKLQAEAKTQRKAIAEEEAAQVQKELVYRVMQLIKRGTAINEAGETVTVEGGQKISIESVKNIPGLNLTDDQIKSLGYGKFGLLAKDGMPVDVAAEMYGFKNGSDMVQSFLNAKPMNEVITERTDARMLAEFGELTDPQAMELEVQKALHNEARARFISVELRFLAKSQQPVRYQLAAAREVAKKILNNKILKDVRPSVFTRQERQAQKAADKAMRKGEPDKAVQAKRNQLVQNQLAKQAVEIQEEFKKALAMYAKIFKADKKLGKNRNIDLVNAARAILSSYGVGPKIDSPLDYVDALKAYNPDFYEQLEPLILDAARGQKDIKQLTVDEFRSLNDLISSLWHQSRRDKTIENEGQQISLDVVLNSLNERLDEIGVPETMPGDKEAPGRKARAMRTINTTKAMLRRVEHWADSMDGEAGYGVFTKFIWRPIKDSINAYRVARNDFVKRYSELVAAVDFGKQKIVATEIGYTFGNENGGLGKAELLGAMLHMGNESNLTKLLLGRGWGSRNPDDTLNTSNWDALIERLIGEGVLTKNDFDFLQSVWDLNEEMKPLAQKAHRDLYGYYFNEVEASSITNQFGTFRGGYVPAKTDYFMTRDAVRNQKIEELEGDFRQSMPSTGLGFTKSRVEYNKPLSLDIRMMTKHIDDVLRFAYIQPAIKDVLKIVKSRSFSDKMNLIDPGAIEEMLIPWLNRAARQTTVEPGMHKSIDAFWQGVRNRTGVGIMFANITNALQQLTGYFPSALKVKGRYLRSGFARYLKSPQKALDEVAALSPFMAERQNSQIFDIQETLNDLLLNPTRYNKVQKWSQKHGYFLQQAFQNQVDTVTWIAVYNQTLAELPAAMSDVKAQKEAIQQADAAVRMTQDSLQAEDLAAFQVGSPLYKTLIQFGGYFNMLANLNATEYTKIFRDLGWRGNKGRLFMTYLLGFALPMLLADAIVRTVGGDWDDDDDDGYLDEVASWFFGSQLRGAAALVPFGNIALVPFNSFNDKPYDDRISTSPSVSVLEAATVGTVRTGINIVQNGEVSGKNIRDVLVLMSLITGIPLTVLGRPIGYAVDVESGKIDPTSEVDYVRGLITGKASSASR